MSVDISKITPTVGAMKPLDLVEDRSVGTVAAESIWRTLEAMTASERVVFFTFLTGNWCPSCGREWDGVPCPCENDE